MYNAIDDVHADGRRKTSGGPANTGSIQAAVHAADLS
jgi:hypothetical protein